MDNSTRYATEGGNVQGGSGSNGLRDDVSGVASRVLFMERLDHWLSGASRRQVKAAVCLVDVDSFSLVNDAFGQAAGDAVLAEAAERLSAAVRPADTVARLYGDEFAILLENLDSESDAIVAARRMQLAFQEPFTVEGNRQHLSVSIGIASGGGEASGDQLLSGADSALSAAKRRGRGRIEIHGEGIRKRALARLRIERELHEALERGELHSVYQPIVSLVEGRIVGFESLLRWEHPQEGTLAPESFMRVAEQSGLIVPIGREVLERACEQAVSWRNGNSAAPTRVYVNVSARQLTDDDFLPMLSDTLLQSGAQADALCIEVTETALLDGDGPEILTEAKRLGVRVVLDDFGTGYSSLTHLSSIPLDEIKIDRSFVERLDSRREAAAIVRAVVSLARDLGVDAVAEGVETEGELDELRSMGCVLAQGFRFARPMNPDAVPGMLFRESRGESLVPTAVPA